jgi:anti-sigma regulatory factor (Ser/Thr protein kinase)
MFVKDAVAEGRVMIDPVAVELATSELVTNAVVHGEGDVALSVLIDNGRVRVEVADSSPHPPIERHAAPEAMSGRGLPIVEAISDRWGIEELPNGGKVVWFTVGGPPVVGHGGSPRD